MQLEIPLELTDSFHPRSPGYKLHDLKCAGQGKVFACDSCGSVVCDKGVVRMPHGFPNDHKEVTILSALFFNQNSSKVPERIDGGCLHCLWRILRIPPMTLRLCLTQEMTMSMRSTQNGYSRQSLTSDC